MSRSMAQNTAPGALPNERVVRFSTRREMEAFIARVGQHDGRILGLIPSLNTVRVRWGSHAQERELGKYLGDGENAEFNYIVLTPTLPGPDSPIWRDGPDRPFYSGALQWMGVPEDNAQWGQGVRIAILDTGVAPHPSLAGADIIAIDLLEVPPDGGQYDGHGTAVASQLVGWSDDLRGIVPGAELLSVRVLDGSGQGDTFTVAAGIIEAVDRAAQVISISLGTYGDSAVLRDAIQYAQDRGVLIVAAAGNDGIDQLPFPARYEGVIAVTAVDAVGTRADFANRGSEMDLAAPGIGVNAAWSDDRYIRFSGTSAATPLVAGAMTFILSEDPRMLGADALGILVSNADDTGSPGWDMESGYGIVSLQRVLQRNQRGIYDAAISAIHIAPEMAFADDPFVTIGVQNRGTEALTNLKLTVIADGLSQDFYSNFLPVGEVWAIDLPVESADLTTDEGVEIRSEVDFGTSHRDAVPENNVRSRVLRVGVEESP